MAGKIIREFLSKQIMLTYWLVHDSRIEQACVESDFDLTVVRQRKSSMSGNAESGCENVSAFGSTAEIWRWSAWHAPPQMSIGAKLAKAVNLDLKSK
jgi:hypothetical protein